RRATACSSDPDGCCTSRRQCGAVVSARLGPAGASARVVKILSATVVDTPLRPFCTKIDTGPLWFSYLIASSGGAVMVWRMTVFAVAFAYPVLPGKNANRLISETSAPKSRGGRGNRSPEAAAVASGLGSALGLNPSTEW